MQAMNADKKNDSVSAHMPLSLEIKDYAGEEFTKFPSVGNLAKKQKYVVGFLFDAAGRRVVLIKKTKPLWQAGKWNGVGGKIEPGEQPLDAMRREFKEETGLFVSDWKHFCILTGVEVRDEKRIEQDFEVHFFTACSIERLAVATQGEEQVEVWMLEDIGTIIPVVYHLPWLIPMALKGSGLVEVKEVN